MAMHFQRVAFWADGHHKVRVIRCDLRLGETGGETDRHLARYCEHLDSKFPGSKVTYSTEAGPCDTASYLVDLDTNEYLLWAAQAGEDLSVC